MFLIGLSCPLGWWCSSLIEPLTLPSVYLCIFCCASFSLTIYRIESLARHSPRTFTNPPPPHSYHLQSPHLLALRLLLRQRLHHPVVCPRSPHSIRQFLDVRLFPSHHCPVRWRGRRGPG
ncbi:hypothetical protein VTI74DRAFT_2072 [Chaetomium olivicolor]